MSDCFIFFLPHRNGGVDTFIQNYVNTITERKIKVVKYKIIDGLFSKIRKTNIDSKEKIEIAFSKHSSQMSRFKLLRKLITERDILICNDSFELEFINYFKLKNKIVYMLHGDLNHYNNILKNNYTIIDQVFCVSDGLKKKYEQIFPQLKFEVSHPFVSNQVKRREHSNELLKCIFIGRFEYLKGADLFLELVSVFKNNIDWNVITLSEESEQNLLDRIPGNVKIYKDISNEKVLDILAEMDVLIFPSRSEGFGIAVLEALTQGVVPIVLDIPIGIPDQVIDSYNGFVIKSENWNEQATMHLKNLIASRSLLTEMKNNGMKFAKKGFDSKLIVSKFVDQINNIILNKEKIFNDIKISFLEKIFPEPLYRLMKMINAKMKYGR